MLPKDLIDHLLLAVPSIMPIYREWKSQSPPRGGQDSSGSSKSLEFQTSVIYQEVITKLIATISYTAAREAQGLD